MKTSYTFSPDLIDKISHDNQLKGSSMFQICTEEQFASYKKRGFDKWKDEQVPLYPYTLEVQGNHTTKFEEVIQPEKFQKRMKSVWYNVNTRYPREDVNNLGCRVYDHQVVINNHHSTKTSEVKIIIMPKRDEADKEEEKIISLGYRDFDKIDKEFDTIQNCESFKFSASDVFGLSIDNSRNDDDREEISITGELELMDNMEINMIPEESDGFLSKMVEARDDLRAEIENRTISW